MSYDKNKLIKLLLITNIILLIIVIAIFSVILLSDYKFIIDWDWGSFCGGCVTLIGVGATLFYYTHTEREKKKPNLRSYFERQVNPHKYDGKMLDANIISLKLRENIKWLPKARYKFDDIKLDKFIIENEGQGVAKNVKIKVENPELNQIFFVPDEFNLNTGEKKYYFINCVDCGEGERFYFNIQITYSDVDYKNEYIQKGYINVSDYQRITPDIRLTQPEKNKDERA